jgi:glycosyltransferase involved in cell wall biosynthesis
VGYTGSFHLQDEFSKDQIVSELAQPKYHKRGWLVKKAVEKAGLGFLGAQPYHYSYVTMPGFYKKGDAIISASTEDGAGLPILEGGAAGKLIISTPVGHFREKVGAAGGEEVPIDEEGFIEKTVEILTYYRDNPVKYRERCLQIQQHAESYDWEHVVKQWVDILT